MKPGVFIYHCATPMIPYHLAHGTYGLMVVEPPGGWPKVDREFYVMQGDIYLKGDSWNRTVFLGGVTRASFQKVSVKPIARRPKLGQTARDSNGRVTAPETAYSSCRSANKPRDRSIPVRPNRALTLCRSWGRTTENLRRDMPTDEKIGQSRNHMGSFPIEMKISETT